MCKLDKKKKEEKHCIRYNTSSLNDRHTYIIFSSQHHIRRQQTTISREIRRLMAFNYMTGLVHRARSHYFACRNSTTTYKLFFKKNLRPTTRSSDKVDVIFPFFFPLEFNGKKYDLCTQNRT